MATADDGIELETVHQAKLKAGGAMANKEVSEGPYCSLERRSDKIGGDSREAVDISPKLTTKKVRKERTAFNRFSSDHCWCCS